MTDVIELNPRWLGKAAMALKLGVSERTVYAMWRRGELRRKEEGGQVLWAIGSQEAVQEGTPAAPHSEGPEGIGTAGTEGGEEGGSGGQPGRAKVELLQARLEHSEAMVAQLERERAQLAAQLEVLSALVAVYARERSSTAGLYARFKAWVVKFF